MRAVEEIPGVVRRARDQLVFARFIGRLAVEQGTVEIRRRLSTDAPNAPADSSAEAVADRPFDAPEEARAQGVNVAGDLDADDLALPDYEQLPAAHIVGKLAGLTAAELDLIESYEISHRGRRTVLGKINQLRAS